MGSSLKVSRFILILDYLLVYLTIPVFVYPYYWVFEALTNFGHYFLVLHFFALITLPFFASSLSRFKRRILFAVHLCFLVFLSGPLLPFFMPVKTADAMQGEKIKIVYANVRTSNSNYDALKEIISREKPDIITILELDSKWDSALASSLEDYAANTKFLRSDNFGIGVFSLLPQSGEAHDFGEDVTPAIKFPLVSRGGRRFDLVSLHSNPPLIDDALYTNWLLLRRVSSATRDSAVPTIIVGDFNATPYSRFYRDFCYWGTLTNALHGKGILKTWNARNPLFQLMIDHVFLHGSWGVVEVQRLDDIGSDHYPLKIEATLPQ